VLLLPVLDTPFFVAPKITRRLADDRSARRFRFAAYVLWIALRWQGAR
jgi:hypothetical protein